MRVSFLGLGKLGLPVALAVTSKGHDVMGYDINPKVLDIISSRRLPYREQGAQELLDKTELKVGSLAEIVSHGDLIFVPIQTPHDPRFEGTTPLPSKRADFDYNFLKAGIKMLAEEIERQGNDKIVIIISTVLPGTIEREIKPLLNKHVKLCYNPFFIAMGTTINDFLNPEIVLFGVDDPEAVEVAEQLYKTIHSRPFFKTSIKNAEAIKVFYNTFISQKIVFANAVMEVSHVQGLDCDAIIDALSMCGDRIISPRYMRGGMGDSGGCHPRDNIALSWFAMQKQLSFDLFGTIMEAREKQTGFLADLVEEHRGNMPIVILGKAYKPETNLTVGSCSTLLQNILASRGIKDVIAYDPYIDGESFQLPNGKALFFIATKHHDFEDFNFPEGSIVIDPFRYIGKDRQGVNVIHIGNPDQPAINEQPLLQA